MLETRADAMDASIGAKVARQALDLVALAFETGVGGAAQLSSTRTTKLLRLKSIIEERLHDPELKPADVSARVVVRTVFTHFCERRVRCDRHRIWPHRRHRRRWNHRWADEFEGWAGHLVQQHQDQPHPVSGYKQIPILERAKRLSSVQRPQ